MSPMDSSSIVHSSSSKLSLPLTQVGPAHCRYAVVGAEMSLDRAKRDMYSYRSRSFSTIQTTMTNCYLNGASVPARISFDSNGRRQTFQANVAQVDASGPRFSAQVDLLYSSNASGLVLSQDWL
ncbi:hypothetical protein C8J56DRAFT_1046845 [Mycena floridula]|nr:hypothetical protein C8J56DRAFT_1046845 [Mycena floridula]